MQEQEMNETKTLDLSMSWEQGLMIFARICLNCTEGSEQEMMEQAQAMGQQIDEICAAYTELNNTNGRNTTNE